MRRIRLVVVATVAAALVFSSVPLAMAGGRGHMRGHRAAYRITKPAVVDTKVVMGVSFDATGVVGPSIAADDASTTVAIEVYGVPVRGHKRPLLTVPAALSSSADIGTLYAATLSLPAAGAYQLVAAVSLGGTVIARSAPRPMLAVLPYRVSKPGVESRKVVTGASFDATGVISPAIAADDASTTVAIRIARVGRHGRLKEPTIVEAVLTGPVGDGTGYSASITLPAKGRYVLVALVVRDGVVLGRSGQREMKAYDPEPAPDPAPDPAPLSTAKPHRH